MNHHPLIPLDVYSALAIALKKNVNIEIDGDRSKRLQSELGMDARKTRIVMAELGCELDRLWCKTHLRHVEQMVATDQTFGDLVDYICQTIEKEDRFERQHDVEEEVEMIVDLFVDAATECWEEDLSDRGVTGTTRVRDLLESLPEHPILNRTNLFGLAIQKVCDHEHVNLPWEDRADTDFCFNQNPTLDNVALAIVKLKRAA